MEIIKKSLSKMIFNLKERFFHHLTADEMQLIKNTQLFDKMDEYAFHKMLRDIRRIKYSPDELICREGEAGDSLFVISDGSVRVFTLDKDGAKTPLARLNKGGYFGEQALLGRAYKTRHANIEAITDTTLIQIKEKYFKEILRADAMLESSLTQKGFEQAITSLRESTGFYFNTEKIFLSIKNPKVLELTKDDLIFNVGDKPDNVYLVLEGEVKLSLPSKTDNTFKNLILHKGHLFGELGVVHNRSRAGTAVANSNLRLLSINGQDFKRYMKESTELQQILASLQQVYRLPLPGVVEQYFGSTKTMGSTITNIYKLDDGRLIISSNFVNHNLFTMYSVTTTTGKKYQFIRDGVHIELEVFDNNLKSIKAVGIWDDLPTLCNMMLENTMIDDAVLAAFERSGEIVTATTTSAAKNEIICQCMSVSSQTLQKLIDSGVKDLPTLAKMTGACTSCRGCTTKIYEMLGENPWITSIIKKLRAHNSYINSFEITPTLSQFKPFKPGQYIIVQARVGENWVERPYTISDVQHNGSLRITLKTEPKGLFSQWLSEHVDNNGVEINTMQPQGEFVLDAEDKRPVVCFAGGIGITPFITFAKSLCAAKSNRRLHVVYFASNADDFIFKDEFEEIVKNQQNITISYRATQEQGALNENEIMSVAKEFNNPDIYICGAQGFVVKVQGTLIRAKYDLAKIHVEQFVHAGVH